MPESVSTGERVTHDWPVDDLKDVRFDPLLERFLREEPIARIRLRFGEGDAWLVTRYEDVKKVTTDARFSRAATVGRPVTSMLPHTVGLPGGIGRTDPPDHTRLARLVTRSISPRRVQQLRSRAQEIAEDLLERMSREGPPADLTQLVTAPFSMQVISELLGVPEADWGRVRQWQKVVLSTTSTRAESDEVRAEMRHYFGVLARRRAGEPAPDMFSELVAARDAGALSTAELISLVYILALNGMEMVRNIGSTMVYVLLTHASVLARLRAEPTVLPAVIEEMLRLIPNRNGVSLPRIAMTDVRLGDVTIRAGEAVYVSYVAANRDPEEFAEPHILDSDRTGNPHLAFGYGIHHCVGAALTRMELEVMLGSLLTRFPGLLLACPPGDVEWLRGIINRGPVSLPVTW